MTLADGTRTVLSNTLPEALSFQTTLSVVGPHTIELAWAQQNGLSGVDSATIEQLP